MTAVAVREKRVGTAMPLLRFVRDRIERVSPKSPYQVGRAAIAFRGAVLLVHHSGGTSVLGRSATCKQRVPFHPLAIDGTAVSDTGPSLMAVPRVPTRNRAARLRAHSTRAQRDRGCDGCPETWVRYRSRYSFSATPPACSQRRWTVRGVPVARVQPRGRTIPTGSRMYSSATVSRASRGA